jgi:hypothetical protein
MKLDRHEVGTALGVALGATAIAAAVFSDEYAQAASAEARGYDALLDAFVSSDRAPAADPLGPVRFLVPWRLSMRADNEHDAQIR